VTIYTPDFSKCFSIFSDDDSILTYNSITNRVGFDAYIMTAQFSICIVQNGIHSEAVQSGDDYCKKNGNHEHMDPCSEEEFIAICKEIQKKYQFNKDVSSLINEEN
jgi:hypothetical protein